MDKRSMGLLNPFEIIIIIALGSAVGDLMFYRNIPLLHGMIVISTIVFIERVIAKLSIRSRMFERLLNGKPFLFGAGLNMSRSKTFDTKNITA